MPMLTLLLATRFAKRNFEKSACLLKIRDKICKKFRGSIKIVKSLNSNNTFYKHPKKEKRNQI
jgi:hypothetical protein